MLCFVFKGRINIVELQKVGVCVCVYVCKCTFCWGMWGGLLGGGQFCWVVCVRVNPLMLMFQIINVDLVHVESRASDVSRQDRGTRLILGQLIDE